MSFGQTTAKAAREIKQIHTGGDFFRTASPLFFTGGRPSLCPFSYFFFQRRKQNLIPESLPFDHMKMFSIRRVS
jgi:hypothetical protein